MRNKLLKLEKKFEKLLPREQRIFPFFVMVCLFLIFQYLLLDPVLKKKNNLKLEHATLKNEVFSLRLKLRGMDKASNTLDNLQKDVSKLTTRFNNLTNRIPSKDKLASILSHLAASEKVKFMVKEMDEQTYVENSRYTVIPFLVTVSGDYFDVLDFLISLENAENRLLKINNIRFARTDLNSMEITALFTVEAYKIRSMEYLIELSKQEALKKEKENDKNKK